MIIAIIGFIFACIPGALVVGWVLLPIAFILAIVGLTRSGQKKGTSITALILSIVGTIIGFVVFLTVVTDAVDDAFSDIDGGELEASTSDSDSEAATEQRDADVGDEVSDEAEDAADSATDAPGTRDNPLAIGDEVQNDDWTITLGSPYEATDEVLAENQFNEEPEAGMEFWILPITATYEGEDTGHAGMDLTAKFVGDDGRTYNDYEPGCGVIPDDLMDIDSLYADGTAEGNTCISVPEGAPGLWTISTLLGDPVFFTAN